MPSLVPSAVLHAVTSPELPPMSRTAPSGVQPTWLPAALAAPGSLKLVTSFGAPGWLTSQMQHLPSLDLVARRCWASGQRQSSLHCPWMAGRGVMTASTLPCVGSCAGTAQATTDPWLVPTNSVSPVSCRQQCQHAKRREVDKGRTAHATHVASATGIVCTHVPSRKSQILACGRQGGVSDVCNAS